MKKILVCIDGSSYADNICLNAAFAAKRMNVHVDLLHVLRRHSEYLAPVNHTGSIGVGSRSELLEELTKLDEDRGRLDQKKGKVILEHGEKVLKDAGVESVETIHRRGSLVETIQEMEKDYEMIFMGKRGEHADLDSIFLGSNLEKVARAIHKPLFVVSSVIRPIKNFLIAYDGKESVQKAIENIQGSDLLKGLKCHLLAVENSAGDIDLSATEKKLVSAGYEVEVKTVQGGSADDVISAYVVEKNIDLLVTGAYSHSRVRSLLLGSTTANLIKACKVPVLLFR